MIASLKRTILPFATAAALLLAWPGPVSAEVFSPETFVLDNGLAVVVVTNRSAPVVSHMIWYRVGAGDEPAGKSGIAHFLEHLMFKGTPEVPDGRFSQIVARNGGNDNAFTSWDFTAYFQNVAADRLELVMQLEADRMVNLTMTEDQVATERQVVIEERRQRTDNDPGSILSEQMNAALYLNSPYRVPVIGWGHEIAELNRDDALDFYRRWYAPNNATVVVSGDVDAASVRSMAERTYGRVPGRPVPERIWPTEPEQLVARRLELKDPRVQQPSWRRMYLAPSYGGPEGERGYALDVLSEILGQGTTSRLYKSLVLDRRVAVDVGVGYRGDGFGPGTFIIGVAPAASASVVEVEAAVDEELARLLNDGPTEAEVAVAKERLMLRSMYARDSLMAPAYAFGTALSVGRTVEDVESWPDRIGLVTEAEVAEAAREVLDMRRSVTGTLLPQDETASQ